MRESVRVDAWVWAVRLFKTRSEATAAARGGHIRVNGVRVKPAQPVRLGDTVQARASVERTVVVKRLLAKRVGAAVAAECFDDLTPPRPREERLLVAARERGLGRPTKRDRRQIERLRRSARGSPAPDE